MRLHPLPLPSLEAFVPEDIWAAEPKLRRRWTSGRLRTNHPHVNDVVAEEDVEPASKNSGGMGRALWQVLLGVIAAVLGANGIWFVQWGLGWWDSVGWSRFGMRYTQKGIDRVAARSCPA